MTEVVITTPPAPADAPASEAPASERPAWLPENFKTPEDLVNSYKELQASSTKAKQGEGEETPPETPEATAEETPPETEQEQSSIPESLRPFSEEFEKAGKFSDESYAKLEELGYPKAMVDAYVAGLAATAPVTAEDEATLMGSVGGEEGYKDLINWAGSNLTAEEIAWYDNAVAKQATAKVAIDWLSARHKAAEGFAPKTQVRGQSAASAPADVFRSMREVQQAQKDPRYTSGDPAYHKDFDAKLARSNLKFT